MNYWSFPRCVFSLRYTPSFPLPLLRMTKKLRKNIGKKAADEGDARTRHSRGKTITYPANRSPREILTYTRYRKTGGRYAEREEKKQESDGRREEKSGKRGRSGMRERDTETTGVTRKLRLGRVKFAGCLSPLIRSLPPDRPSLVPLLLILVLLLPYSTIYCFFFFLIILRATAYRKAGLLFSHRLAESPPSLLRLKCRPGRGWMKKNIH